jgi:hypothetical protein
MMSINADALPRERRVEVALDPVARRAVAVLVQRFLDLRFLTVELRAAQQHRPDPAGLRAVRIIRRLDLRVVLAVDGDPFLRHHAGRHPQPEAEKVRRDRMQVEAAVGLAAMQENGDRGDRDVSQHQRDDDIAPPRQRREPMGGEGEKIRSH